MKLYKLILIVPLLVILTLQAQAASTKIHESWHYSGDSFILQDLPYEISFSASNPNNIFLQFGNYNALIYESECVEKAHLTVCYAEKEEDIYISQYKIKLAVYSKTADITITRDIDDEELFVGEEATITVKLENDGHNDATQLLYQDTLPNEVEITSTNKVQKEGNIITFSKDIKKGEEETFSYTIKAKKKLDQTIKAHLNYVNTKEQINKTSTSIHLIINPLLEVTPTFDNESFYIDGETKFRITLRNKDTKKLTIKDLTINIPKSLIIEKTSPKTVSKITTNIFRLTGILEGGGSDELIFNVRGKLSGTSYVYITGEYEKDNNGYEIEEKEEVEIKDKGIEIITNIKDNEELESGRGKKVVVNVRNNYPEMDLKYVDVNFITNLTDNEGKYFSKLEKYTTTEVMKFTIIAPFVTSTTTYPFIIQAYYKTKHNEQFNKKYTKNMKIKPIPILDITHSLSKTSLEPGELLTVEVSLKNNRLIDLYDVEVSDMFSSPLLTPNTKSSRTMNIESGTTRKVYAYQLTIPDVNEDTTYTINTTATYIDSINYTYNKQSSFTVSPIIPSATEEKTLSPRLRKTVDDSALYVSELININYEIENTENEDIYDIVLVFPKQQTLDRVGEIKIEVADYLGQGEEIILKAIEQIRPKFNGTLYINETILEFKDAEGKRYTVKSNKGTVKIDKGYIQGPLLFLTKNASHTQNDVLITIEIENKGDAAANLNLEDGAKKWSFSLDKGKKRKILYTVPIIYDYQELPEALLTYNYLNKKITAYSNKATVNIPRPISKVEEVKEKIEVAEEEQATSETQEEIEEEGKNFLGFITFIINKLFKRGE